MYAKSIHIYIHPSYPIVINVNKRFLDFAHKKVVYLAPL